MKPYGDGNLQCRSTVLPRTNRIVYIITPAELNDDDVMRWAQQANCNIAVIYDIDWAKDLAPWDAEAKSVNDECAGGASNFLRHLTTQAIPTIEKALGYLQRPERALVGIGMAGLFAIWSLTQAEPFDHICSLGAPLSFPHFIEWFQSQDLSRFHGKAFLSAGADAKATATPDDAIQTVADKLRQSPAITRYESETADGALERAIEWILRPTA